MKHTLTQQISRKCIHFTGIMQKTCDKGMIYDDVDKELRLPYRAALPCFEPDAAQLERLAGKPQCTCPYTQFPTPEEVAAREEEIANAMQKTMQALAVVAPIRKEHKGKDWNGVLECPNCKGRLHVRHAGCNGHVWAKCETKDCVAWIE